MDSGDDELELANERWTLANMLKFWRECPRKQCRRARECCGDPNMCHGIFWPVVPEQFKVWFAAIAEAKRDGSSVRQAGRYADSKVAGWRKRQAAVAKLSQ